MSNVVSLTGFRCPVGGMAMHQDLGLVDVFAQDEWMRGVVYEHHETRDLAGEPEDVLFVENIEMREAWVHVRELRDADLARDIESLRRSGKLFSVD